MSSKVQKRKVRDPEERRSAILEAALATFTEKGFASARMEDIAKHAGVAKGTVYLYFPDKESLFKALIETTMTPVLEHVTQFMNTCDMSPRDMLSAVYDMIEHNVLMTQKRNLLRLIITEMGNFPDVAEYYHQIMVSRGLSLLQTLLEMADDRGELRSRHVLDVPQVAFAPIVMSVVWGTLFSNADPINNRAAFDFYLDSLFKPARDTTL